MNRTDRMTSRVLTIIFGGALALAIVMMMGILSQPAQLKAQPVTNPQPIGNYWLSSTTWVPASTAAPLPVAANVGGAAAATNNGASSATTMRVTIANDSTGQVRLANIYPQNATVLTASSGNVANASAVATLAGAASVTTYICGFQMTSAGSTGAAVVSPTIAGLISGTMTFTYATVAGVTLNNPILAMPFTPCIPASAVNTSIVVTLPALGAGNTNATASAWGFRQ